jgi:HAD superfamily hydrolase (TIGR01662 family)
MNVPGRIKAVLFDNDGTLSNSVPIIIQATNNALCSAGYDDCPDEEIIDGMRIKTVERMMSHIKTDDVQIGKDLAAGFYSQMDLLIDDIKLFPGISGGLKTLEKKGYPMGLVSNNACFIIERVLANNGIRNFFSFIIGEDNAEETKPGPGGLLQACRLLDIDPGLCVYVGDSLSDSESAEAAGMKSIGVTWNTHDPVDVRTLEFTATIDNIDQLLPTVLSFN